jgi:hypothetical protein
MIVNAIYTLCALTALMCTIMLVRSYRVSGYKLLLWAGVCFAGLTINNLMLLVDKILIPEGDLSLWRTATAFVSMLVLVVGLVWEAE